MRKYAIYLTVCALFISCTPKKKDAPQPIHKAHHPLLVLPTEATDLDPADDRVHVRLVAARSPDPQALFPYAYNGLNPGPVIRARLGDRVIVDLDNQLHAATTIHWHGVKVPFAMDGVAWMGSPVAAGEGFRYEFDVNQVGTFWYHPHFNTERQVDGGLYGFLIVEAPEEPRADEELLLVFDTADEFDEVLDALPDGQAGRRSHGHGQLRPKWRINGHEGPFSHRAQGGQRIRVRLLNVSNHNYLNLQWPNIRHIAGDQGLLPSLQSPDSIQLAPGDRAEVEWLLGGEDLVVKEAPWSINGGRTYQHPHELIRVEVQEPQPEPEGLPWPFPGGEVSPDPPYTDLLYVFSGSDRTGIWLINGERFPEITVEQLTLGQTAIIEVRNLSPTEHPFHIHGLNFEVLSVNGTPPPYKTIEDTWNLRIRDQLRLKVIADNPGSWMTHCHILPHAGDGMMTVIDVR